MLSFYLDWLKIVFNNKAKRVHKLIELFGTDFYKPNSDFFPSLLFSFQVYKTLKQPIFKLNSFK
jgi:hypothetical protein